MYSRLYAYACGVRKSRKRSALCQAFRNYSLSVLILPLASTMINKKKKTKRRLPAIFNTTTRVHSLKQPRIYRLVVLKPTSKAPKRIYPEAPYISTKRSILSYARDHGEFPLLRKECASEHFRESGGAKNNSALFRISHALPHLRFALFYLLPRFETLGVGR